MKKSSRLIFGFISASLCWLLYTFTTDIYMYSDNVGVALVINGYYGSPLSQYQHPLFCLSVNALARMFTTIDMYSAVVHAFIYFELVMLVLLLTGNVFCKRLQNWKLVDYAVLALSIMICVFLSAGINLWRANYTIQAGSFLFVGWLILAEHDKHERKTLWITIGTVYIAVGYMLRKEVGLLFMPFVALFVLYRILAAEKHKEIAKHLSRSLFPACLCMLVLFLIQAAFNATEPYAEAKRYNDARTAMVDFPVEEWDGEDPAFDGIAEADYLATENWFFADTEIVTVDYLEKMETAGSTNKYQFNAYGIRRALQDMWRIVGKTDVYMSMMALICVLLALWNVIFQHSWWSKGAAFCSTLGTFIIMLYFAFRGRAPLRVWQPVLFGLLFVETELLLSCLSQVKAISRDTLLLLLFIIFYYSAGQVMAHIKFHDRPQNAFTGCVDVDESAYEQTFTADDLYIWPNWHGTIPKEFGWMKGKLPTQRVLEHNIPLGDWTYGQPYYTGFLERIGHSNPIRDLVEKDNVFIMDNGRYIINFLREHYGSDIELVESGEINGATAYKVRRAE